MHHQLAVKVFETFLVTAGKLLRECVHMYMCIYVCAVVFHALNV